ncbi:MAG TPA: hypothetical protein PKD79_04415, partial [Candidatus Doudnabacteria bacterium]|nr:hypothetical protein [Candidatus Doudnabacteria bacterium]
MPTLRTANNSESVFRTQSGSTPSHHFRLVGLNIVRVNNTSQQTNLIEWGTRGSQQNTLEKIPHHFVIDRSLFQGSANAHTRRAIDLNARDVEITNSYFTNFWESGSDSQAILIANTSGNIVIRNNFLEAGSENILVGGVDVYVPNMVPTNITIEHNHIYKPLSWRGNSPNKNVKNHIELKYGKHVMIRHNIIENNWAEGQNGNSINFVPINQEGSNPWATVEDVTVEYNIIKNVGIAFQWGASYDSTAQNSKRITASNNLILINSGMSSPSAWPIVLSRGYDPAVADTWVFTHNTFYGPAARISPGDANDMIDQFIVTHNIFSPASGSFGPIDTGSNSGTAGIEEVAINWTWEGNVHRRAQGTGFQQHPNNNYYPASVAEIGFINADAAGSNLKLANNSPYKGVAPGGLDPGVNWDVLMAATANVVS